VKEIRCRRVWLSWVADNPVAPLESEVSYNDMDVDGEEYMDVDGAEPHLDGKSHMGNAGSGTFQQDGLDLGGPAMEIPNDEEVSVLRCFPWLA